MANIDYKPHNLQKIFYLLPVWIFSGVAIIGIVGTIGFGLSFLLTLLTILGGFVFGGCVVLFVKFIISYIAENF